jgi:hypothetical protein
MFTISNDKSARGQLQGVLAELQRNVRSISQERRNLEDGGKQRTDAYKSLTAKKAALNETIAFIENVDVMSSTYQEPTSGAPGHVITFSSYLRQPFNIPRYTPTCACSTEPLADTSSLLLADRAVGKHLREMEARGSQR